MSLFSNKDKKIDMNSAVKTNHSSASDLFDSIDDNIKFVKDLFKDVDILRARSFENNHNSKIKYAIFYSEGLVDTNLINHYIIEPLISTEIISKDKDLISYIKDKVIVNSIVKKSTETKEIIEAISYGDTVVFVDGSSSALLLDSKKFNLRGPVEPEGERVLSGPREGFVEGIMTNISMVRRRLLTNELKLKFMKIGKQSKTSVCVAYLDNVVNKNILKEVLRRLEKIDIDAIIDSNYLVEFIAEKSPFGFNTTGATERPDVVVGKVLEGRIAIFVDGTPVVITAPYLFVENFQSSEDYYLHPIYASFSRILRIVSFIIGVTVPGLFITMVGFHHEMLPSALMINFATERTGVPLPAAPECFLLLFMFDLLRETGVRMPYHVGQTMSIVGALVIGQAAVEANLVAGPMIIVVAFAGITILLIPRLTTATLVSRYMCLIFASTLGYTGLMVSVAIILVHILNLHSFGVPVLLSFRNLKTQEVKDSFVRMSWPKMLTRMGPLATNIKRQSKLQDKR